MNRYLGLLISIICFIGLQSCKEEETFDVVGNPNNLAYFPSAGKILEGESASYSVNITRTPSSVIADKYQVKFAIRTTRPVETDTRINVEVDLGLVDKYNLLHGTDYKASPFTELKKATVIIPAGTYDSKDSIEVMIPSEKMSDFTEKTYLLPLRLKSSNEIAVSKKNDEAYIVFTVVRRFINPSASVDSFNGILISEHTGWTIQSTDGEANVGNLIDGKDNTGTKFPTLQSPEIMIDLGGIKKVTGLSFLNTNSSQIGYFIYTTMNISLSEDGVVWTDTDNSGTMQIRDRKQFVIFYAPTACRYIKLNVGWVYGWYNQYYRSAQEINVYGE